MKTDNIFSRNKMEFRDILEEKKIKNYVWWWMTNSFHLKQAFSHKFNFNNPLFFTYNVLFDKQLDLLIQQVLPCSSNQGRFHHLNCLLNEIGFSKNIIVIRFLGLILTKIMKKIIQSIYVSQDKILKLKHNMGRNPVILVPTHRSYADFILMTFLCLNYEMEIPVVVAGMDFHAMLGMALLLRQCGAMYMRRSFKDDKIYSAVLKKYIQTVITHNSSPFEFFIEGTRSRSGKSLTPKLGILKMIIEVFLSGEVDDVTFVPVAINYDRFLEDILFVREVLGIPKPKESTTSFLKAITLLDKRYGNVYINFGPEISLRNFYEKCENQAFLLSYLAHTIIIRQQENTVLTFFNILSAIIVEQLQSKGENFFSISFLTEKVDRLKYFLIFLGTTTFVNNDIHTELDRALKIHKFLIKNTMDHTIHVTSIDSDNKFGICSNQLVIPFILLQHYANPCYFHLINHGIIITILSKEKCLKRDVLFSLFQLFRKLLKHEFVFCQDFEHEEFENSCDKLTDLNILEIVDNDKIILIASNELTGLCRNLLISFIKCYLLVCQSLNQLINCNRDLSVLKSEIKQRLESELITSDDYSLFYSLSSNFISNTISSLIDAKILLVLNERITSNNCIHLISFLRYFIEDKVPGFDKQSMYSVTCKL